MPVGPGQMLKTQEIQLTWWPTLKEFDTASSKYLVSE